MILIGRFGNSACHGCGISVPVLAAVVPERLINGAILSDLLLKYLRAWDEWPLCQYHSYGVSVWSSGIALNPYVAGG